MLEHFNKKKVITNVPNMILLLIKCLISVLQKSPSSLDRQHCCTVINLLLDCN